jgi:cobalt/nickel transport system ATP-binding protein
VAAGLGLLVQDPDDQLLGTRLAEDTAIGPTNLGCSPEERDRRVREALAAVGLTQLAEREVETLSLGERKRAALAGVLAMQPQLLLLDEPTAGLDPDAERAVCALLCTEREQGRTLLVATHAVDLVPYFATRVIVLAEGRVLADGSCREVLTQPELLARAHLRRPWPAELWQRARGGAALDMPLTMEEVLSRL